MLNVSWKGKGKVYKKIDERVKIVESLIGIIPADVSLEQSREERLKKYECNDD